MGLIKRTRKRGVNLTWHPSDEFPLGAKTVEWHGTALADKIKSILLAYDRIADVTIGCELIVLETKVDGAKLYYSWTGEKFEQGKEPKP